MKSAVFATAALVAAAAADSVGSAIVVNKCNYDVYLSAVPSADGGYSEVDKTLSPYDTFTQGWTELTNNNGWSIKLSNTTYSTNILQYEYTFQGDGTIWYDLSEVNGNPWDGDWEITSSTASCSPKQQAYRYATDDAYGMQACPADASITVTLCSGESQNDAGAASASSSFAAESSSAVAASTSLGASTTVAAPTSVGAVTSTTSKAVNITSPSTASPSTASFNTTSMETPSTTLVTSVSTVTSASSSGSDEVDVVITVTQVATTTHWTHHWGPPSKRDGHQHHARHPHARN